MRVTLKRTIAASLAVLAIGTVVGSTSASAHFVASSMHVIPFSSAHPGNLVNNVNNEPNVVRGFPKGPTMVQSPDHYKGRYGYWGAGFGFGGSEMASSDGTCFEYRRIYDRWGHYLGRQPINVCQ
jgi:hypothetical protein